MGWLEVLVGHFRHEKKYYSEAELNTFYSNLRYIVSCLRPIFFCIWLNYWKRLTNTGNEVSLEITELNSIKMASCYPKVKITTG